MSHFRPVRALLFDLDGTLIDSEPQTDEAIALVAARHGVAGFSLPATETHGCTWAHVASLMRSLAGLEVSAVALADELLAAWNEATRNVQPIPGAPQALQAAARGQLKLAVVSSSPRSVIDRFVLRLGAEALIGAHARVGGDDVRRGKPDPEGYLKAAQALAVEPAEALVFEDSRAGLLAARAAGMRSLLVTCRALDVPALAPLATGCIRDYQALPGQFWEQLVSGRGELAGGVLA